MFVAHDATVPIRKLMAMAYFQGWSNMTMTRVAYIVASFPLYPFERFIH